MSVCTQCRRAIARSLRSRQFAPQRATMTTKSSQQPQTSSTSDILSKPTWSIRSLLSASAPTETITSSQLHHLLRLSALPLPTTPKEEQRMITTLQSQLRFVRAVQQVNTKGVEPLRAIRDETDEGLKEQTIGLEELKDALESEVKVGYYQRARRIRDGKRINEEAEKWDVLGTASRKAGKFFVVDAGKKEENVS
ncbi:glu-tRNAGln amidotransferase C subunit domain-containing protein [Sarocladium implicatum]|nr:glu-tRNAGln amidotransferase C subunit domain-containing protein [Sarocladium implicatum]